MTDHSIILLGGPDSGKTNYLVRLWHALKARRFSLVAPRSPRNITYVEGLIEFILQGQFVPHTDVSDHPTDQQLEIPIVRSSSPDGGEVTLSVPDVSGELWQGAIDRGDVPRPWMDALQSSAGALLFVRVGSKENVPSLDWANTPDVLSLLDDGAAINGDGDVPKVPTQVALCEMLRFLDETLLREDGVLPRVAIMITAWDLLDPETQSNGPDAYLKAEYPLLAGRLHDCRTLDVRTFGVSIVGGDFDDDKFKERFFDADIDETGFTTYLDGDNALTKKIDLTVPVAWVLDRIFDDE
jgi:hypothetical protein